MKGSAASSIILTSFWRCRAGLFDILHDGGRGRQANCPRDDFRGGLSAPLFDVVPAPVKQQEGCDNRGEGNAALIRARHGPDNLSHGRNQRADKLPDSRQDWPHWAKKAEIK